MEEKKTWVMNILQAHGNPSVALIEHIGFFITLRLPICTVNDKKGIDGKRV